jgi:serine/threonine protein kinase
VKPLIAPLRKTDPKSFQGWTLKGFIAEGGQSTIYLAEKNGERAALKMIRKEYLSNQKSTDRFFTEIKNLERLDHPHISRVLEVEDSGQFLAIEFIDGPNLEDYVKESGALGFQQWLKLAQTLASTVNYCHSQGIIHKDISPRNIIIGPNGPVLVDFGISYLEKDERLTSDGEIIGTPPFMSPEHFGITAPKQMDVFSLGGTLIFAATGHYPFSGTNSAEWRESILFSPPDFAGLSIAQINLLSPLLYKKSEVRGSLEDFSQLISELASSDWESKFVAKKFAKVVRESPDKLIQEKKQLAVKKQITKKVFAATALIAILSAGIVAYGIVAIQSNSRDGATIVTAPEMNTSIEPSPMENESTGNQINSATSIACKDEYSSKGSKVVEICLPSAKNGEISSIYYLGRFYFDKQNYTEAEKWLLRGAKESDLNSTRYLIDTYTQLSNATQRDRWTKICADTSYGETDTSPLKDIAYCKMMQGFILTRAGANKEAILYLTDAADYGSGDAATWLGLYYRDLDQKEKAIKFLTRAAELGSTNGLNSLISYADTIGDNALAKKWLLVSANDGNQVNMGVLAFTFYAEKDLSSAKKWAIKGASFGDILSIYVQGAVAYDEGKKVEGKALLVKAADKGSISAMRKLGSIYRLEEKNYEEAAIWYEKLAARNDFVGTSMYSALLFMLGKDKESCTYNDKVLELGNQAKKNGTYESSYMDKIMTDSKSTADSYCSKMYKSS